MTRLGRKRITLTCFVLFSFFLSLFKGSTSIPIDQLLFSNNDLFRTIFFEVRLPHALTAFTCGGLLALAGALIQLLLENPLADPYVLGISGGSACAALLVIVLDMNLCWLVPGAWLGGLLTILFVLLLTHKHHFHSHSLLVLGMSLACGFSALMSFLLLISPEKKLHSMLFWLAGDLNETTSPWLGLAILGIGSSLCYLFAPGFTLLNRGEIAARALGLRTAHYRLLLYLLSSLLTATAVTLGGCIGFIGLFIPHLTRRLVGYDYRTIIPFTVLLGGGFLTLTDVCARLLFAPYQLPIGIGMALLGVPLLIGALKR